jgi:hypothetical protein
MKGLNKVVYAESQDKIKSLIYGPSGNGKTRFLGTANQDERTFPILILDYEGGMSTLRGMKPKPEIFKIRSWADYNEAYSILSDTTCPYKSVGLDSISEAHIFSLMSQLDNNQRTHKIADLLEQGDYGIALVQMRRLLRAFRDLPLHVFCTALDKSDLDPREGTVKKPAMSGAMGDEVMGIFDVVGYLGITSIVEQPAEGGDPQPFTHRVLALQNYPKIRTKVRVPEDMRIPDELMDPTVTNLLDLLAYT